MKIRFTERQIQNLINENIESQNIAQQYLNNPNNEVLWRCFNSEHENSIFEHGYTSEYFGDGEGSLYGEGVYAFFKPYGAAKRVGTGGVGDKIMKCALIGGFKDFIILKKDLAEKYYGSSDIRVQLKYFFGEKNVNVIYQKCLEVSNIYGCHIVSNGWTGPVAREVFGTKYGAFKNLVLSSKVKGIVYNGKNDPNAVVIFNPRTVIPIAVTKEKTLQGENATDFTTWTYRLGKDLVKKINKFKDYYSIGEHLIKLGEIKSYLKQPPQYNLLRVVLNNGKTSFYNVQTETLISKVGFDEIFYPEEINGHIAIAFNLTLPKGKIMLYIVKSENDYYICKRSGLKFNAIMTIARYDKEFSKGTLNEGFEGIPRDSERVFRDITGLSCKLESVFHRTKDMTSCKSIGEYGFSPQYSTTEVYGHGIYTTTSVESCNRALQDYGRYMIHGYLKEGFKNFIIFNEELARKYYGDKYRVSDQIKLLIRPEHYDYMIQKYHSLIEYPQDDLLVSIYKDIGKTNIRGVVVRYHSGSILAPVICDWKSVIPYEYSEDNGATWKQLLTRQSYEHINSHKDGLFAIQQLIADGVVVDTFSKNGYYDWSKISSHPQFINGYLRVQLTNGNISFYSAEDDDLISYRGFVNAVGWDKDKKGLLKLDCTCDIDGREYPFRVYKLPNGSYVLCYLDKNDRKYKKVTSLKNYDKE